MNTSNSRFQDAAAAGFTAAQMPRLQLKEAYGFPGESTRMGAPNLNYKTANGVTAHGGSLASAGPVIGFGMLYVNSSYSPAGEMPGSGVFGGRCMKSAVLLALTAGAIYAQNVQVYSEFAQLNEAGEVVAPANPREILSPAVARNAYSSFQIAIQVPKGTKFLVYIGQNPDDAAKVTLYRRRAGKIEPVELPYSGESSQVLWMDLWVDANAPVRRVKIEPQVGIDGDWITYPMEVRVMEPVVPNHSDPGEGVASAFEVMRVYLCGGKIRPIAGRVPIGAELVFRNAQQDVALAAADSVPLRDEMKKAMGGCSANPPADPEFYLRLRDYLFTPLGKKVR